MSDHYERGWRNTSNVVFGYQEMSHKPFKGRIHLYAGACAAEPTFFFFLI
jgi:hypothetical protein